MNSMLGRAWDRFRGGGDAAVTVAPMDGALLPNNALEDAALWEPGITVDNLARVDASYVLYSCGPQLKSRAMDDSIGASQTLRMFDSDISCLAVCRPDDLAVGLEAGRLWVSTTGKEPFELTSFAGEPITCPVAMAFADPNTLYVCLGSRDTRPSQWKRDLLSRNASGSVWKLDVAARTAARIADALAYPCGILCLPDGSVLVSESWRHRLLCIGPNGRRSVVLGDLPGYPGRLTGDSTGNGGWLAVFAPRRQLIELVLRERRYCERMMEEIEPEYWVAPSLHPPRSHLDSLQYGCIKQLGELKPWAPSRSYGLVVQLDQHFRPISSFHSRADGRRHGATSCVVLGNRLLVTCKGGDGIVALNLPAGLGS